MYRVFIVALVSLVFVKCGNNKFEVAKGKVGALTTKTTVKEIDGIF